MKHLKREVTASLLFYFLLSVTVGNAQFMSGDGAGYSLESTDMLPAEAMESNGQRYPGGDGSGYSGDAFQLFASVPAPFSNRFVGSTGSGYSNQRLSLDAGPSGAAESFRYQGSNGSGYDNWVLTTFEMTNSAGQAHRYLGGSGSGSASTTLSLSTNLAPPLASSDFAKNLAYPNPVQKMIFFSQLRNERVIVFDQQGKLLMQRMLEGNQLDVSDLNGGVYFLMVDTHIWKFIKVSN